jgi:hypothetical protein
MDSRVTSLTCVAALVALAACGGSSLATSPSPAPAGCSSGPPEAGVHNPERLQVLAACRHAAGVAVDVVHEADGDYHVWFRVDPAYQLLLNAENHFQGRPAMLAEITPDCPPGSNPPDGAAAAKCPKSRLPIPRIGDHFAVDGPWVLDVDHGWREIHPVDSIQIR